MKGAQSLTEKIEQVLNEVLPDNPAAALNGTELIQKVLERFPDQKENTLRNYFSRLSKDPSSILAKKVDGQGYYRKSISELPLENLSEEQVEEVKEKARGREIQGEEKFRSVFKKYFEYDDYYPFVIEHTKGKGGKRKGKGMDKWKYPDVVLLQWKNLMFDDERGKISDTMLNIVTSLGEQPFKLMSVELKVELTASNYREYFFQCVSNSKWAHEPILAVAAKIEPESLVAEVLRLGKAYGVKIITFGLDEEFIERLPNASKILEMEEGKFVDQIAKKIDFKTLTSGTERHGLDWDFIQDLRKPFEDLFEWISYCLQQKDFFTFEEYERVIEQKNKARERTQRK